MSMYITYVEIFYIRQTLAQKRFSRTPDTGKTDDRTPRPRGGDLFHPECSVRHVMIISYSVTKCMYI